MSILSTFCECCSPFLYFFFSAEESALFYLPLVAGSHINVMSESRFISSTKGGAKIGYFRSGNKIKSDGDTKANKASRPTICHFTNTYLWPFQFKRASINIIVFFVQICVNFHYKSYSDVIMGSASKLCPSYFYFCLPKKSYFYFFYPFISQLGAQLWNIVEERTRAAA